jgi:hypothetical protein
VNPRDAGIYGGLCNPSAPNRFGPMGRLPTHTDLGGNLATIVFLIRTTSLKPSKPGNAMRDMIVLPLMIIQILVFGALRMIYMLFHPLPYVGFGNYGNWITRV